MLAAFIHINAKLSHHRLSDLTLLCLSSIVTVMLAIVMTALRLEHQSPCCIDLIVHLFDVITTLLNNNTNNNHVPQHIQNHALTQTQQH